MKKFKSLVIKRNSIVDHVSMDLNSNIPAGWIEVNAIHRSSAYNKIQRMGYVIVLLFEKGSEKEDLLKKGVFKNFKTNHQAKNKQNQK